MSTKHATYTKARASHLTVHCLHFFIQKPCDATTPVTTYSCQHKRQRNASAFGFTVTSVIYLIGFTLSQATKALRESRGIALLYFRPQHWKGVRGQRHAPAAPYSRERPGTHCAGGWVDLRASSF